MILIVSRPDCDHTPVVARELRARGERVCVFDVAELPSRASLSISFEPGSPFRAKVERSLDPFYLEEVEAVWLRRVGFPGVTPGPDAGFAAAEVHHALVGLGQALHERRWVNRLGALSLDGGWGKVLQLRVAGEVGLETPRTLITNSPEQAREFIDSCPKGAIYKPLASVELGGRSLYTTAVDAALSAQLQRVKRAPCIFQERVEKALEVRFAVMGQRVFACGIHSQESPESAVDYRVRCYNLRREPHRLPDEVSQKLLQLHQRLGLVFGTGDLILRPDGGYTWLETNQQGQWLEVMKAEGLDLLSPFCDLLQGR